MSHTLEFDVRNLVLGTWIYRGEEYDKPLTAAETSSLAAITAAIKALRTNKEHTMDVVAVRCRGEVARHLTAGRTRPDLSRCCERPPASLAPRRRSTALPPAPQADE